MGLKLRDDILRPIQFSGGNLILPSSIVTLQDANKNPGQQFKNDQDIQVAVPAFSTVLELWFVYLVAPGGSPQIVTSQNINSLGPAGFTTWKLVGAFYTGADHFAQAAPGVARFGAFVNTVGRPATKEFSIGRSLLQGTGGILTSLGTVTVDYATFKRNGKAATQKSSLKTGSGTTGSASGSWLMPIGGGVGLAEPDATGTDSLDDTPLIAGSSRNALRGSAYTTNSSTGKTGTATLTNNPIWGMLMNYDQPSGSNDTAGTVNQLITQATFEMATHMVDVPIQQFSETPLEDL